MITDLFMPEMDGFPMMEIVRDEYPELPITVISGEGDRGDVIRALRVADLIRQGQSTKSIASILNASTSTVEKHRNSIRKKFKILNKKGNL